MPDIGLPPMLTRAQAVQTMRHYTLCVKCDRWVGNEGTFEEPRPGTHICVQPWMD